MAIEGFSPPPSPSPPSPPSYYQLLERGSARLGRVKKTRYSAFNPMGMHGFCMEVESKSQLS